MRTRRCGAVAGVVLLLAMAAPAWAVEIAIVPPPAPHQDAPPAPATGDCGCSWLNWVTSWFSPKFCPTWVCIKKDCRKGCPLACLPHTGYYATRWRFLPSEADLPPASAASPEPAESPESPEPKPSNSGGELLPLPMTEPNKNGNNNSRNKGERLPQPRNNPGANNNSGMTYVPVYVTPYGPLSPVSATRGR